MPDITVTHIALMAIIAVLGVIIGWVLRGSRSAQEKAAVNAGWQDQLDAQRREGDRLVEQNKGLMEQVSQFQASHTDAKNRARELSSAVQEAYARRDELQREIKDIRSNLEVAVSERDQLQSDMAARSSDTDILQEKDARIEKLSRELANWQNRLPPLIDRFRVRNEEATQLEAELERARARIRELESLRRAVPDDQTRIEPVSDPAELTDGLDASNDAEEEPGPDVEARDEDDNENQDQDQDEDPDGDDPDEEPVDDDAAEEPNGDDADEEPETGTHNLRDDLQQIKGVGPAIEKTLNEMGIFSYQQIADMSEYDIDRIARRLKGFRTRIYREDWIGQARELRDQAMHA